MSEWRHLTFARGAAVFVGLVLALMLAGPAEALNSQAYLFITNGCCVLKGSRANIWSPAQTQTTLYDNDFFVTSAYADDGSSKDSLIQAGITYEYGNGEAPDCYGGLYSRALYYFVEVEAGTDNYLCYEKGLASWNTPHMFSVDRGNDGNWYSYKDGSPLNVHTAWTGCSGNACSIAAFGEKYRTVANGRWQAIFSGTTYTPWQKYSPGVWSTVNSYYSHFDSNWTPYVTGFPYGEWEIDFDL